MRSPAGLARCRTSRLLATTVVLLACTGASAEAATLYADSSLKEDVTNGAYHVERRDATGNDGNAYATIQAAVEAMSPGDTLLLRSGTFKEHSINLRNKRGAKDAWVDTVLELSELGKTVKAPAAAISTVYYVSPDTTSTDWAAARSIKTPCMVQTAFDNARAGDVVQFRGGVYKVPPRNEGDWLTGYYAPNHSGTEKAPIVFMAYSGETPVFDGASGGKVDRDGHGYYNRSCIMSNSRLVGDSHTHHEYITFDGFTFQADGGVAEPRISMTGGDNYTKNPRVKGLIVQNCVFNGGVKDNEARRKDASGKQVGTGDNREGIFVSQVTGMIIRNCKIYDYAHQSNNGNTSGIKTYHSDHISIENCEIYDCNRGIFAKSNTDDLDVKYCYIHDNQTGFYTGTGGWWRGKDHAKGYFSIENANIRLYHNLFANNRSIAISAFTQDGCDLDGMQIFNNTIYSGEKKSSTVALGSGVGQSFYNNIQYGMRTDSSIGLLSWQTGRNDPKAVAEGKAEFNMELDAVDHNQFGNLKGNLVIRVRKPNETPLTFRFLAAWQSSGVLKNGADPGEGSLASNPLFVNASGKMNTVADFALKDDSPCCGTGRDGKDMGADVERVGLVAD